MHRAIFLDRDGTLIVEKHYLSDPAEVTLYPQAGPALQRLRRAGFLLFLVTNQSGIGRGYFTVNDLEQVHARIASELAAAQVRFEKVYVAPEAPGQPSRGRKPSPQFLFDAREEFGVDLSASYFIGDKRIDLECGWNAGVKGSILVRTGYGAAEESQLEAGRPDLAVVDDLAAAADWVLTREDQPGPGGATIGRARGRTLGLIPARYGSTRFPGKPLALIAGKPLIQHVVERCRQAAALDDVIVATDDERIAKVAKPVCRVALTRGNHLTGTDRIAEVVEREECSAVVNIQGDEPLIDPKVIDAVAEALERFELTTAASALTDAAEYEDPNVVKVVVSQAGQALYFSRRAIPCVRDAARRSAAEQLAAFPFLKHLGIYGYRREALFRLVRWPLSPLEAAEKLEQLRALDHGLAMGVVTVKYESAGVDVPEDVERVERLLARR